MKRPAFRRSWWGYNTRDVDLFLQEIAVERERLQDSLTRVETLMAEWQCGPEAILAAAHREAAEIRANAERDTRTAPKPAAGRVQVISLNPPMRDFSAISDSLPIPRNTGSFLSEDPLDEDAGLPTAELGATGSDMKAIDALERTRGSRRRTRRIMGLVAVCASVVVVIGFGFSDRGAEMSYGEVNALTAVNPAPARRSGATSKSTRSGSSPVTTVQDSTRARTPSAAPTKTLMVTISAVKQCWIRTVVDGGQQMERLLQPADTVMLHATNEVLLKAGDAGAISLLINNQPIKPLGRSGEVVTQLITRANYSSLLRTEF